MTTGSSLSLTILCDLTTCNNAYDAFSHPVLLAVGNRTTPIGGICNEGHRESRERFAGDVDAECIVDIREVDDRLKSNTKGRQG